MTRLSAAASRTIIKKMALILLREVPELSSEDACIMALLAHRYRAAVIEDHIDAARDIAFQARLDEAELWERLQHPLRR